MKPNAIKPIQLTQVRNLTKFQETIEDDDNPGTIHLALIPTWARNAPTATVPLYIQVNTFEGFAHTKYTLKLTEMGTNKVLFQNINSSQGLQASKKIKVEINKSKSYILSVQCSTPSYSKRAWYNPFITLYFPRIQFNIGPYRSQQGVEEFPYV